VKVVYVVNGETQMNKILSTTVGLILSASCVTASATVYNITEVLNGIDDSFKFSGFHFAGEHMDPDANFLNRDGKAATGIQITRFLTTPVSGTYDDFTGAINMVLNLDPDDFGGINPGTVTFSGNMFFDPTLNPAATLSAVFSDVDTDGMGNPVGIDTEGWLLNTSMVFDAGLVACCSGANQRPNSFDGSTISLWGANFDSSGENPTLGLDLRIALTAVPVPAAVWLFGSGLLGLVAVARRKSA
jgi:hypothetical protein